MFPWSISNIQPFYPFELIKVFIDFLLNSLYLLGLINTTTIFPILPRFDFYIWKALVPHISLKLRKLFNDLSGYFDSLVLRCSRGIFNFAIVNADQVALLIII